MHETQARQGVRRGAAVLLAMVLALSLGWQRTWADEERQLIPVGKAVGIKLFADGVLVVSVSPVQGTEETRSPAKECGLKEGDILLTFNGEKIRSTEHLQAMLAENGETAAELTVQRDGKTLEVTASPVVCEDGGIRLGAWIRDSMAGVGTLTYYDPATGAFGALGHGINDVDTSTLMEMNDGTLYQTEIISIRKGAAGQPGEMTGMIVYSDDRILGDITSNSIRGIFGKCNQKALALGTEEALPIGLKQEIEKGPAQILCTVDGTTRYYDIEITEIHLDHDNVNRGIELRVTDPELLSVTGGIVQGMSGAPIIQKGKFVGAVTHVLVQDSTRGYGIFIENMLE